MTVNGDSNLKFINNVNYTPLTDSCRAFISGTHEHSTIRSISLFPNPSSSVLNISDEQNDLQNSTIEIINSIGQTVLRMPFSTTIDISGLENGCYFLNTTTSGNQTLHYKFIKQE